MNTPYVFRKCTNCGEWLVANSNNFYKTKRGKFGLNSKCKACEKEYRKQHYKENKECIKEYGKQYREEHKEYYKEYNKQYRKENKEKLKEYNKQYREENKENLKEYRKQYNKQYREENKENLKEHNKQYYEEHKEYYKEYKKQHYKENKEHYREHNKQYYEENKENLKEYRKQYREENKEKLKEYRKQYFTSERGKLIRFNNRTKRRALMDKQGKGITKEQWLEMMKFFDWKCAYSGETLGTKTRTIDHIAPLAQGGVHEIWNLTPMLFSYNSSKNSRLSVMNWYEEQEYFNEERLAKIVEWQQYAYDKYATEDDDPLILITDLYTGDDDIWLEK